MVEAVVARTDEDACKLVGIVIPDETNHHRTLNLAAPYGRYRTRMLRKDQQGVRKAIGPSDTDLGEEKEVVMPAARPEESVKRIEQAGKLYEALKRKYAKLAERIE